MKGVYSNQKKGEHKQREQEVSPKRQVEEEPHVEAVHLVSVVGAPGSLQSGVLTPILILSEYQFCCLLLHIYFF